MRMIVLRKLWPVVAAVCVGCGGGDVRPPKARAVADDGGVAAPGDPSGATASGSAAGMDGGAPRATPGTGDARLIGSLSSKELIEVCRTSQRSMARSLAAQVEIECTASSVEATANDDACEQERQKCIASQAQPAPDEGACESEAPTLAHDCADVTVATLRACEDAWSDKLERAAQAVGCGSTVEQIRAISDQSTPKECQSLDSACAH